jgi:signal peptidase I
MFSFLYSDQKKMRQNAGNWLEVADRVHKFRRDQLSEAQTAKLAGAVGEVKLRLQEQADTGRIKQAVEKLEGALRETGGRIYPVSSIVENVEFFLVAAIVILGVRAYFFQPFKIPTNSMWPTYYGKTHASDAPGQSPGIASKLWRFATLGAWHYKAEAPADGELKVAVFADGSLAFTQQAGRTFGVLPAVERQFSFQVGGETASVVIPGAGTSTDDFRFEKVLNDLVARQGVHASWTDLLAATVRQRANLDSTIMLVNFDGRTREQRVYWIPTGLMLKKGEPIVSFDLLTGDLLFVDRISYNFIRPEVGHGFVFQTKNIPDIGSDQYYIKRLVGTPGDVLEVQAPVLFRNGMPISGAQAFIDNATRTAPYRGYSNTAFPNGKYLAKGEKLQVPNGKYFAMGDNSLESSDSRFWGFVPEKDVVGRPLFIYYPLTSRWGPAK